MLEEVKAMHSTPFCPASPTKKSSSESSGDFYGTLAGIIKYEPVGLTFHNL